MRLTPRWRGIAVPRLPRPVAGTSPAARFSVRRPVGIDWIYANRTADSVRDPAMPIQQTVTRYVYRLAARGAPATLLLFVFDFVVFVSLVVKEAAFGTLEPRLEFARMIRLHDDVLLLDQAVLPEVEQRIVKELHPIFPPR